MKYTGNEICPKCGATGTSIITNEQGMKKIAVGFIAATETDPEHLALQCRECAYQWTAEPQDAP